MCSSAEDVARIRLPEPEPVPTGDIERVSMGAV